MLPRMMENQLAKKLDNWLETECTQGFVGLCVRHANI